MKKIFLVLVAIGIYSTSIAQTRADIFDKSISVTWLGIDFTQVNFIGTAAQWQDAGAIDSEQLREKYFVAWNELFVTEKDKYNILEYAHKKNVNYEIEVVASANSKSDRDYFVDDAGQYRHLDENKISELVSNYNFKGHIGLGLLFFVEGMHKEAKKASVWVVYVNMKDKKVLLAERVDGKPGGFGFRNYWAKSFFNTLREIDGNFGKWKKNK